VNLCADWNDLNGVGFYKHHKLEGTEGSMLLEKAGTARAQQQHLADNLFIYLRDCVLLI
jgi:hypothetical protein